MWLAAQKQWPHQHPAKPGFDHRTKMERLATILLPNPVAAHDTKRGAVDGSAKLFKENSTVQNSPSLAETAVTEFRVRCFQSRTYREAEPRSGWQALSVLRWLRRPRAYVVALSPQEPAVHHHLIATSICVNAPLIGVATLSVN